MLTKSLKKNHSIFAKRTKKRIFKNGIFHKYPLQRHHLDLIYRKYTFKNYTSKLAHFLKNRIKPLNLCLNIQNVGLLNIFQPSLNRLALAGGTTKISRTIAHNLIQQKKKNIKEQFRRRIVTRIYTLNKLRKKCSMPRSRK